MSLDDIKALIPDYAKDLRLNLSALPTIASLSPVQLYGCILACALASRQPDVIRMAQSLAAQHLQPAEQAAAKAAAAIMGMNNIYYRATHLMAEKDYAQMRANLRMSVIAQPGTDKANFELWSLAVSAINGCGQCLDAHERTLRTHGVDKQQIQDALRIAAILHAVAATIEGEKVLAGAA